MGFGAVIAAAGQNFGSAFMGNYFAKKQQKRGYKYNQWLQDDSQDFAREMYGEQKKEARYWADHGHRREVAALRRAGLNPILAATGGFRGSAGSGSALGAGTNSTGVGNSAKAELRMAQDYATLDLLKEQKLNIAFDTDLKHQKSMTEVENRKTVELGNAAREIQLNEAKERTKWRTGKKGQTWRNFLVPAKDYMDTFNPFSAVNVNQSHIQHSK